VSIPLLKTKLYIPSVRPGLVSRPRLLERLNASLHRKLTLVSAPAGFGKTTLVSEWVASHRCGGPRLGARGEATPPTAIAWLSLDESDNDLTRFLTYLIGALQTVEIDVGKGVLSALQSPQPPPVEAILTVLINEIAALPDWTVLVLDDYHLVEAQPIHDALTFLLRHLPPQMHLVIATREDPPLPLARLRARGQLTELRATDLRFASSEAAELLGQVMGLDLSAEDVAALETRTEGWGAGLQLAALAMQGTSMQGRKDVTGFIQSFAGSHRYVLDYLIEEVLEQQPTSVQEFLLQTSILDRLTGPLCDALTGQADGQATLEMLERANLFIVSLDEERRWYRYHHLFADLLRQRLDQAQQDWVSMLHIRASEWFEQNGFVDQAIEHALRAEDFERAVYLIGESVDALWQRGEHTKLRRWLVEFPGELLFSKPYLCIFYAWSLFTSGQMDAAERSLQAAEQATESLSPAHKDQLSEADTMKLRGRAAVIQAFLDDYRGDVPGIIQHARQALTYLPEHDLTWRGIVAMELGDVHAFRGNMTAAYQARLAASEACKAAGDIYFFIFASLKLAMTLRAQGQLQRTIEVCQQRLQLASKSGLSQTAVAGCLLATWGETLAELDDLEEALHQARTGAERTERGGDLAMLGWSYMCLTRVLFSRGELAAAEEIIQKIEGAVRESDVHRWVTHQMAAWRTRLWLVQSKLDTAFQWVEERGLDIDFKPKSLHETNIFVLSDYVVLARILIAQGQFDEATGLLPCLLEAAEAGGYISKAVELLNLQALAFQAGGDTDQAIVVVGKALAFAEPGGFIRIFVDEGPPMAHLLYKALSRGIARDYVRRLLAAFPVTEPGQTDVSKILASNSELIEPLSDRELEVLRLFAEGLTNREIASRLFLALNTVKAHAGNIYGKLNVHSRTQAIARAQALGLLLPK
jgi:LuxR family maltose regulon positive regulatory protein